MSSKFWIIFKQEYMSRLKTKAFVIMTLIGPLLLALLTIVPAVVAIYSMKGDTKTVAVSDATGLIVDRLNADNSSNFEPVSGTPDEIKRQVLEGTYDAFLAVPEGILTGDGNPEIFTGQGAGFTYVASLESDLTRIVREERMKGAGIDPNLVDEIRKPVKLEAIVLSDDGEKKDSGAGSMIIGFVMAMLMYIVVFIYGSFVMQGVMAEKQSRIMEVVISSARPFDLMMGKVMAMGALGLTQLLAWAVGGIALTTFAGAALSGFLDPSSMNLPGEAQQAVADSSAFAMPEIPFLLIGAFIVFFIGGYLMYASLFAAVGASVDEPQDAQQLMLPVASPLILSIIFMQAVISNPNGGLATFLSMFPLTSPVLMVVRMAAVDVPVWQVGLSLLFLAAGIIAAIWVASKIYRIGVLMYGKKASFKDLAKWIRYT